MNAQEKVREIALAWIRYETARYELMKINPVAVHNVETSKLKDACEYADAMERALEASKEGQR